MPRRRKHYNADPAYTYIYTLKSNELFGPFSNTTCANQWAKMTNITSYITVSDRVRVEKLRTHIINAPYFS